MPFSFLFPDVKPLTLISFFVTKTRQYEMAPGDIYV